MMRILNHGGRCCGIKHIIDFPYFPTDTVSALPARTVYHGPSVEMKNPSKDFHPGGLLSDKAEERLRKLLEYLDHQKDAHLAEIVLPRYTSDHWTAVLLKFGFKKVIEFENSNTDTVLHVWHRVTYYGKIPTKEKS